MSYFKNKKILITGHTGFKGSWLSFWLSSIGAEVMGISYGPQTKPSNFNILNIKKKIKSKNIDIANFNSIKREIFNFQPNFIFHLAAEAIVKKSFQNPINAWRTNTLGTINILESLRTYNKKVVVVIITSDKVYKNKEIKKGYREKDELGNFDPYSSSKTCADIASQSYINSFFKNKNNIKIALARAGNVIGGGDWSQDRLIPDCIRSWKKNKKVLIRNPKSTRPWQHVFDVLNGYMKLSIDLDRRNNNNGEIFNFGPKFLKKNYEVINVIKLIKLNWDKVKWKIQAQKKKNVFYESRLLYLNSKKAKTHLGWECVLNLNETILYTIEWYKKYIQNPKEINEFSLNQIKKFEKILKNNK